MAMARASLVRSSLAWLHVCSRCTEWWLSWASSFQLLWEGRREDMRTGVTVPSMKRAVNAHVGDWEHAQTVRRRSPSGQLEALHSEWSAQAQPGPKLGPTGSTWAKERSEPRHAQADRVVGSTRVLVLTSSDVWAPTQELVSLTPWLGAGTRDTMLVLGWVWPEVRRGEAGEHGDPLRSGLAPPVSEETDHSRSGRWEKVKQTRFRGDFRKGDKGRTTKSNGYTTVDQRTSVRASRCLSSVAGTSRLCCESWKTGRSCRRASASCQPPTQRTEQSNKPNCRSEWSRTERSGRRASAPTSQVREVRSLPFKWSLLAAPSGYLLVLVFCSFLLCVGTPGLLPCWVSRVNLRACGRVLIEECVDIELGSEYRGLFPSTFGTVLGLWKLIGTIDDRVVRRTSRRTRWRRGQEKPRDRVRQSLFCISDQKGGVDTVVEPHNFV